MEKRKRLSGIFRAAKTYCKDPIEMIPGYLDALTAKEPYDLHHILELTIDGQRALSVDDLRRMGMYENRPYFELIFLPRKMHQSMHNVGQNNFFHLVKDKESAREKMRLSLVGHRGWNRGKKWTSETKEAMSRSHLGKRPTEEVRAHLKEIAEIRANEYHSYKENGGQWSYNKWSSELWPSIRSNLYV